MRLASFIREYEADIIGEWENFAQTLKPAAEGMGFHSLRNHIHEILTFIANDIESAQTGTEQIKKSHGKKVKFGYSAAESHAAIRLAAGFNLDQMVSEYRALRTSVIKLWKAKVTESTKQDILDMIRFNESIDQELTESICHYSHKVTHSKDLLLGILSHDLRTPLNAAIMSAQLMMKIGALNERQTMLCFQAIDCVSRANEIVTNLFDLTRARFGSGLPVSRELTDMGFVSRQLVEEMRVVYPERAITLDVSGDLEGKWDKTRIGQVFSNLISNAIQYGFSDLPVKVNVSGTPTEAIVSVHNEGVPIRAEKLERIFDSLTRGSDEDDENEPASVHLGLGLYITKEIVISHGGTISVTSSEKGG